MRLFLFTNAAAAAYLAVAVKVALAAPSSLVSNLAAPTIKLPQGTLTGIRQQIDGVDLELFLGVPFAKPPTGSLRFAAPVPVEEGHNIQIDASNYGFACPQPAPKVATSEDCLTVNIIRPAGTTSHDRLPVLQWIYGGAFTTGASALYNGTRIVAESVNASKPIMWVSANYVSGRCSRLSCILLSITYPSSSHMILPFPMTANRSMGFHGRHRIHSCKSQEPLPHDTQCRSIRSEIIIPLGAQECRQIWR